MADWLNEILKKDVADSSDAGTLDARRDDADGRQLAQKTNAMHDELVWLDEPAVNPSADLGLESTERSRAARAYNRTRSRNGR